MNEFAISATASLQERRSRILKYGDMFAVFDQNGDLALGDGGVEGLYASDTRYLSQLDLRLSGARPILLSSTTRDDNATLTCDLTNPDLYDEATGSFSTTISFISAARSFSSGRCAMSDWRSGTSPIRSSGGGWKSVSMPTSPICSRCAGRGGSGAAAWSVPRSRAMRSPSPIRAWTAADA